MQVSERSVKALLRNVDVQPLVVGLPVLTTTCTGVQSRQQEQNSTASSFLPSGCRWEITWSTSMRDTAHCSSAVCMVMLPTGSG